LSPKGGNFLLEEYIYLYYNKLKFQYIGVIFLIDFKDIHKYKENNRIEAKKALGGFPHSLWETYSAFANTIGGIILLGVIERPDKSFRTVNLPNPLDYVSEFWSTVKNRKKVSANILKEENVQIININGDNIIAIEVPRADRKDKPIYIGEDPFTGSYRRSGEGDYHCTRDEVLNMLSDRETQSKDRKVLENFDLKVFDFETVKRYRKLLNETTLVHCENLNDIEFLEKIKALKNNHPTIAGLLMFGKESEIKKKFPNFLLSYTEKTEDIKYRIISNSGEFSGNLFDFYLLVLDRIKSEIKLNKPMQYALNEALVNAIVHANYYGENGLVIEKRKKEIIISNPGGLRISTEDAISGVRSDPRNALLINMFNLIKISKKRGKGLSKINKIWKKQGLGSLKLKEEFNPDRTVLLLKLTRDNKASDEEKQKIIDFLTLNVQGTQKDFVKILNLKAGVVNAILKELEKEDIITINEKVYKLKS